MLIQLRDGLIVSQNMILWAGRNGNYTEVFLKSGRMESIWDEDKTVWHSLEEATKKRGTDERW